MKALLILDSRGQRLLAKVQRGPPRATAQGPPQLPQGPCPGPPCTPRLRHLPPAKLQDLKGSWC